MLFIHKTILSYPKNTLKWLIVCSILIRYPTVLGDNENHTHTHTQTDTKERNKISRTTHFSF